MYSLFSKLLLSGLFALACKPIPFALFNNSAMARSKGNPQVLIVKHIIRVFCRFTSSHKADGYALSSKSRGHFSSRDEFLNRSCGALPGDVPKGHCAVYVGSERSRYIIPTKYLNHSLFRELLDKAEEAYGFDHQMGLTIPCEEVAFQYLTSILGEKGVASRDMKMDELIVCPSSTEIGLIAFRSEEHHCSQCYLHLMMHPPAKIWLKQKQGLDRRTGQPVHSFGLMSN